MPTTSAPDIGSMARVIRAEFREMPGMRLTEAQVRRLEREKEILKKATALLMSDSLNQ